MLQGDLGEPLLPILSVLLTASGASPRRWAWAPRSRAAPHSGAGVSVIEADLRRLVGVSPQICKAGRPMDEAQRSKAKATKLVGLPSYQTLTNWLKTYEVQR